MKEKLKRVTHAVTGFVALSILILSVVIIKTIWWIKEKLSGTNTKGK